MSSTTVDLDVRVRSDLAPHLPNDLARDSYAALAHELLGRAARRDSAIGEHLLEPDQPGSLGVVAAPSRTSAPSGLSARGRSSRLCRPKHSRNSHVVPYRMGRPGASLRPRSSMSRREASV